MDEYEQTALAIRENYCAHTGFCDTAGNCPKCVNDPMTQYIAKALVAAADKARMEAFEEAARLCDAYETQCQAKVKPHIYDTDAMRVRSECAEWLASEIRAAKVKP